MCTAITYQTNNFYFGRNLDYNFSYDEKITVVPRKFPFRFRGGREITSHFAMIGMAYTPDKFPLFYDAVNEKGLCMAGLNFVGNAVYQSPKEGAENVAQFELIPYLLGQCDSVKQAVECLKKINLTDVAYSEKLPVAQLHWIVADKTDCVTVESVEGGLRIYPNPVGVLANNPPFPLQLFQLNHYRKLSARDSENLFSDKLNLTKYSRGMGAIGLPGDLSSQSRFVRATFVKFNSVSGDSEEESVNQFFHILGSVEQQSGCCFVNENEYEYTIYTSCCNADKGIYYYTTYENHAIAAVDMYQENLNGSELSFFSIIRRERIHFQN